MSQVPAAIEAAFTAGFRPDQQTGCWVWLGRPNGQGYGRASLGRRKTCRAHRLSWLIHKGPIPDGLCVLHDCDNRLCVNPNHLFLGTRGDNARDMAAKGRQFLQQHPERAKRGDDHPARINPGCLARGTRHPMTTLTEEDVLEIRTRFAAGETKRLLAARFRTSASTIGNIIAGRYWRHVGGPTFPLRVIKRRRTNHVPRPASEQAEGVATQPQEEL